MALLLLAGLAVAGIVASGYLAHGISQTFQASGVQQQFSTVDEVSDRLLSIGRPDLAQQLSIAVAERNSAAFSLGGGGTPQQSLLGSLGLGEVKEMIPLVLIGYLLLKVVK